MAAVQVVTLLGVVQPIAALLEAPTGLGLVSEGELSGLETERRDVLLGTPPCIDRWRTQDKVRLTLCSRISALQRASTGTRGLSSILLPFGSPCATQKLLFSCLLLLILSLFKCQFCTEFAI